MKPDSEANIFDITHPGWRDEELVRLRAENEGLWRSVKAHEAGSLEIGKDIDRLRAENERLTALLKEASQYVSDACRRDEDPETQTHSGGLLGEIDKALAASREE